MKARMEDLERQKAELTAKLVEAPDDTPDILPRTAQVYGQRIARLTEALNRPEDRAEATEVLRDLIEKIVLRPGPKRGEIEATLHGELRTILEWVERQAIGKAQNTNTPGALAPGVSVSVVEGTRGHCWHKTARPLDFFRFKKIENAHKLAA